LIASINEKVEQLAMIDKLKSNMISNISHRLMAPLSTISGFMEILQNQYFGTLNKRQLEYCYEISKSAEELAEAVDAIIYSADIEAGQLKLKFTEVKLLDFINRILGQFAVKAEMCGITISTTFVDNDFKAIFDEPSMRKAVSQLVSRAIKMTPAEGEIMLGVEAHSQNLSAFDLLVCNVGISPSDEDIIKISKILQGDVDVHNIDMKIDFGILLANSVLKLHHGTMAIERVSDNRTAIRCRIPVHQFLR
jgi:signal transduction histidine kinase